MFYLVTKRLAVLALLVVPIFAQNDKIKIYLALGDSIAFGYDPTVLPPPGSTYPKPNQYTGYPEVVANIEQVKKEINAACPGQTSGSFLFPAQEDIGCMGFRAAIGLHTNYGGSQIDFAVSQLSDKVDLVTISIGGNDLTMLQNRCATQTAVPFEVCIGGGIGNVLATYGMNLTTIVSTIRAHYTGTLVIVNNYSPNANPLFIGAVSALNGVMAPVGTPFRAKLADAFTAFQVASLLSAGDPCKAGLLVRLSSTTCDVHPSKRGRDLIAAAVEVAIHLPPGR